MGNMSMGEKKTLFNSISKIFGSSEQKEEIKTSILIPSPECHSEEEFMKRMLFKISGCYKKIAIIQQPDRHSLSELKQERELMKAEGGILKIPALIVPTDRARVNFMPYIIIFTHDNKLFMHPYGSEAFSDIGDD